MLPAPKSLPLFFPNPTGAVSAQPPSGSVEPTPLAPAAGEVVGWFRQQLMERKLVPGEKLPPERILADHLGVSRLPLREGMKWLQARGLLTIQHGRGAFVGATADPGVIADALLPLQLAPAVNSSGIDEFNHLWGLIEPELAALAADGFAREPASQPVADRLLIAADVGTAPSSGSQAWRLHAEVASLAGNRLLEALHGAVGIHLAPRLATMSWSTGRAERHPQLSLDYARAVLAGDRAAARQAATAVVQHLVAGLTA